jgi:hypothetical protein
MADTQLINAFISLNDIINNFLISYTGPGRVIPDADRTEVILHARRCLQEFAFETLKSQFNKTTTIPANGEYKQPDDNVAIISIFRSASSGGVTYTVEMSETKELANIDGTNYYVDYTNKKIIFDTSLDGYGLSYTYLSNALTIDETAAVPKLAEEALYACMIYAILANRESTNPNTLQRLLMEKMLKLEKSKSRLVFTNFE